LIVNSVFIYKNKNGVAKRRQFQRMKRERIVIQSALTAQGIL